MTPYLFEAVEARSFRHPVFTGIQKYTFLIQAEKLPVGLPTGANARDPVGMNRRVYREVKESLKATEALAGSFDMMNLGITILADRVELVDKTRSLYRAFISDEDGIVNGAHTAKLIETCQEEGTVPPEQHVEVRIITGVDSANHADLKADIAKGQNTGITVKAQSIYDTMGLFDSLKERISGETWSDDVAWKESDSGKIQSADLICLMEALNVVSFPNEGNSHPIHAYEKQSKALENYASDYKKHEADPQNRVFAAFEPILLEALELYDRIRRDYRGVFNEHVSQSAGRLRIVEEAPRNGTFEFPFSKAPACKYRLTKGAALPMFASFRNCVGYDADRNMAYWKGGFQTVLGLWEQAAPEIAQETYGSRRDIGHIPDQLGKSRTYWTNLHRAMALRTLRLEMARQQ